MNDSCSKISEVANQIQVLLKASKNFVSFFGWKQLIKVSTRLTRSSYAITYHILASYFKLYKSFCLIISLLSKLGKPLQLRERGSDKQINFLSFKHYKVHLFEQSPSKLSFPNF